MKTYKRTSGKQVLQAARIRELGIGGYAFETSLFGEKPFELNVNMPTFKTERKAEIWIEKQPNWERG